LAAALARSLRSVAQAGRPPKIVEKLEAIAGQSTPAGTAVVALFEEANEYLDRFGSEAAGILLIVDELGKFLEYNASEPEQGDVFVLQELAEAATRAKRPFLFLTILHQAIDRYADQMSPGKRAEWSKVQGRFEDVAFEEQSEQVLRLLSYAIRREGSESVQKGLQKRARSLAQEVAGLGVRSGSMQPAELQDCLAKCYPLHPLTALVLGPLFRQLAQNERSLFAFLASTEPFGFQEFLRTHIADDGVYGLDCLYDYVIASLGPNLFAQHRGKLWSEVQTALDRLHQASDLEVRLAKCVGLLQALGVGCGVSASVGVLRAAVNGAEDDEVDRAIRSLTERSVVVFRRHTGSYALWEGSDVDIEDRLQAARQAVEHEQKLAPFLTRELSPEPMIARRHYFQTGTLRYFETVYCDRDDFQSDLFQLGITGEPEDADGRVLLCLPRDTDERGAMRATLESTASERPILAALPHDVSELRELCHELACLRWISEHTPELESDRTARRELHARLVLAEQNLRMSLERLFSPSNPHCLWYCRGTRVHLNSSRQLNDLLSQASDEVYASTPCWRNELVNRRVLSSSAAAARRNLIEAMFEKGDREGLGFEGHPPERSMYEVLLKATRFHREQAGSFGFHPPDEQAETAVRAVWGAIDDFLAESETTRQSIKTLFARLRRPPFGLKDGVLHVLLAVLLVHGQSEVALYEEGTFVPRPNAAVFERIFRSPQKFDLQRFRIVGPRAEVFHRYATMLTRSRSEPDLLGIVRPLVKVVRELPDYVSKTKHLGLTAQRVLKVVKDARQPDRLLFTDLPVACGFAPFAATGTVDTTQAEAYFSELRVAFGELQRAYPQLIDEVERLIVTAFGQEGKLAAARTHIDHAARYVLEIAVDPKLRAFLLRAIDATVEDTTWVESIATLLAGKPPPHWDDQDRARFEVQLSGMARTFEHFRVLAFEMQRKGAALLDGDPKMLRVSVTAPDAGEVERVVVVPADFQQQALRARDGLLRVLRDEGVLEKTDVSVAVLAQLVRELLGEPEKK
jgi:hypothetical protein